MSCLQTALSRFVSKLSLVSIKLYNTLPDFIFFLPFSWLNSFFYGNENLVQCPQVRPLCVLPCVFTSRVALFGFGPMLGLDLTAPRAWAIVLRCLLLNLLGQLVLARGLHKVASEKAEFGAQEFAVALSNRCKLVSLFCTDQLKLFFGN